MKIIKRDGREVPYDYTKIQKAIEAANAESARIMERTQREIELEKSKVRDDMKKEMITVATEMAGRFVSDSMTAEKQDQLLDSVLKEMGDSTWQG